MGRLLGSDTASAQGEARHHKEQEPSHWFVTGSVTVKVAPPGPALNSDGPAMRSYVLGGKGQTEPGAVHRTAATCGRPPEEPLEDLPLLADRYPRPSVFHADRGS